MLFVFKGQSHVDPTRPMDPFRAYIARGRNGARNALRRTSGRHTIHNFTPTVLPVHVYYGSSPLDKLDAISNHSSASHSRRPTPQHTRSFYRSRPRLFSHPANPPHPQFYISSTHIINIAILSVAIRFAHYLGPRHTGTLRTGLGRHLTYEAATALNDNLGASAGTTNLGLDLVEIALGEAGVCPLLPSGWSGQPRREIDEEQEPDGPQPGEKGT
ncbi:unnamed protein product [Rhizoctonia solani]|uniref:Uncharacterized protein n=1 Tax=Rhizoctonia solani TaxID=456999 RepID=A0A8H3BXF0_9AGAM|nr:unnamed protein product [Rhizoctonia solani]